MNLSFGRGHGHSNVNNNVNNNSFKHMNRSDWPVPYYAVIFSSRRTESDAEGYGEMNERMSELAAQQPGYLGIESYRNETGEGGTISYWKTEEDIRNWKAHWEHLRAQRMGRKQWYEYYHLQVCRVERAYGFSI